jgi:hypothetical protein
VSDLSDQEVYQEIGAIVSRFSLRLERLGIGESITQNGVHYGVEVRGRVFDNLSSDGLIRDEWIRDFDSHNGEFLVEELENF